MAVGVFWKKLASTYFIQDGSDIKRTPDLFANTQDWFLIDPTVVGGPTTVSNTVTLNTIRNNATTLTSPTSNCSASSWASAGWDISGDAGGPNFLVQLGDWVSENFDNPALNINYNAMNLLYTEVNIGGTGYILACCYFGNTGSIAVLDGGEFTTLDYAYSLVGYTFTDTIDNPQPVDGGLFVYT